MTRKFAPPPTKFQGSVSAQPKPRAVTKGAVVPAPPTRFGAVASVQAKCPPDIVAPAGNGRVVQAMMFGQNFQEEQASPAELMAAFGERIRFSAAMSDFLVSEFPPDNAFAEPEEMEGIDEEPVYQQAPQFDFSKLFLQQKVEPVWQNSSIQMAGKKKGAKKHIGVTDGTYKPGKKFIESPSSKKAYIVHKYDNRDFYYQKDASGRVTEMQGTLRHVIAKRQKTGKVKNKRKDDHSSHLIAHSLGGDPKFTDNYVSMKASINSQGGEWHQMEHYVRERLKKANSKAYMACILEYNGTAKGRPSRIRVSVYFNRIPYKVDFTINTP